MTVNFIDQYIMNIEGTRMMQHVSSDNEVKINYKILSRSI